MVNKTVRKIAYALTAIICTGAICITATACGSSSQKEGTKDAFAELSDKPFTVKGEMGKKPTITFKTPYDVKNYTYQIAREGNGKKAEDGDQLCLHQIVLNPSTGKEISSTWASSPVCNTFLTKSGMQEGFYKLFKNMRVNSTVVIGVKSSSTSTQSSSAQPASYLLALTLTDAKKVPARASGTPVAPADPSLPKVALGKNGEPSISGLDTYKSNGSLVAQTLIKGSGAAVKASDTVTVQYKGWLLGGDASKPFDSSWSRGGPATFSLSQVVKGWTNGLAGQTVGSQVLLVVPPSEGYGDTAQNGIPANSTLVFVVDILSAQ